MLAPVCTLSWLEREGEDGAPAGYDLFFNRDESAARAPARGPALATEAGVPFLAPTDTEAGGTWLATNVHGVTVGVLNAAGEATGRVAPESRGHLVRALAASVSLADLEERLLARELRRTRGFRLAAFAPAVLPRVWSWDGSVLAPESPCFPLASSSLGSERAHEIRRGVLDGLSAEAGRLDAGVLEAFHTSHLPEAGPWSPCVHRERVRTVSVCHVRVGPERVAMRYAPGRPCESRFEPAVELARDAAATRPR